MEGGRCGGGERLPDASSAPEAAEPFEVTDLWLSVRALLADVEVERGGREMPEMPITEEEEVARLREEAEGRVEARAELGREVVVEERLD